MLLSCTIFGLGFQKRNHCPLVVSKSCKSCAMKSQQRRFRPLNIFPLCAIRTNDSFPEPLVRIKNQIFIHKLYTITSLGNRKQRCGLRYSQPICHQQLYDEPPGLSAELGKHALFEGHIVVPDVQDRAAVVLAGEWRNSRQADHRGVKMFHGDQFFSEVIT